MPYAIQYGMTPDQFWHEDIKLFDVYSQAYAMNKSYTAWINGKYVMDAVMLGVNNAFADKQSKRIDYPDYIDPFAQKEEQVTAENLEEKHRNLMAENANWLKSLLRGEKGA